MMTNQFTPEAIERRFQQQQERRRRVMKDWLIWLMGRMYQ